MKPNTKEHLKAVNWVIFFGLVLLLLVFIKTDKAAAAYTCVVATPECDFNPFPPSFNEVCRFTPITCNYGCDSTFVHDPLCNADRLTQSCSYLYEYQYQYEYEYPTPTYPTPIYTYEYQYEYQYETPAYATPAYATPAYEYQYETPAYATPAYATPAYEYQYEYQYQYQYEYEYQYQTPVVPPVAPSNLTLDNSTTCSHIILHWTDNSTNESGFKIYRGTSAGSLALLNTVGANITTYNDTPPSTGTSYYYAVSSFTTSPVQESAKTSTVSALNQTCIANFVNNQTNKTLTKINGATYTTSTPISNGDTITFQVSLRNTGPAAGIVNYICDTPSTNFTSLRNVAVVGGGTANFSGSDCSSGTEIKVSGMSVAANTTRTITYDSTYQSTGSGNLELCSNTAVFNYTDSSSNNQTVKFGPTLCNRSSTGGPSFQEVTP